MLNGVNGRSHSAEIGPQDDDDDAVDTNKSGEYLLISVSMVASKAQ